MHYVDLKMLFTEIIMQDTMNDEFLVRPDISDPVEGYILMVIVYIVIPAVLWAIAEIWLRWKKRK